MATRPRLVALERSFNFRDLGGYVGHHGMVTRWGTLFRSDTLHELTSPDLETVRALGLATIVDLRTGRELERTGRGPLAEEPTAFRHLSLIRDGEGEAMAAPAPPGEELSQRYGWYLDGGRDSLVEALRLLADPSNLPLVFHCAGGPRSWNGWRSCSLSRPTQADRWGWRGWRDVHRCRPGEGVPDGARIARWTAA